MVRGKGRGRSRGGRLKGDGGRGRGAIERASGSPIGEGSSLQTGQQGAAST